MCKLALSESLSFVRRVVSQKAERVFAILRNAGECRLLVVLDLVLLSSATKGGSRYLRGVQV
jgi:hypothetical protein